MRIKALKTLLLSLLIFCMVCPAVSFAGTNKTLDLVLSPDFTDVLGAELVTNGDPFVAGSWNLPGEVTVVGGDLVCDGTQGATVIARQDGSAGLTVGKVYLYSINVTAITGTMAVKLGGGPIRN